MVYWDQVGIWGNEEGNKWLSKNILLRRSQCTGILHIDAYDYGIRGYLFQVIDGHQKPIIFLSKAFDSDVKHIEKEKNIEADGFSRLIIIPEEEELEPYEIDENKLYVLRAHTH